MTNIGNIMNKEKTKLEAEIMEFFKEREPQVKYLYHYTTPEGLKGIIEKKQLWITDRNFMNDAEDRKYPIDLFEEKKIELKNKFKDGEGDIVNILNQFSTEMTEYVFSLSLEGDLSNQWAQYSKNSGYCLVFNAKKLIQYMHDNICYNSCRMSLTFNHVIYNKKDQLDLIDIYLRNIDDMYENVKNEPFGELRCFAVYNQITSNIKHYNNHCEKEYRFIFSEHNMIKDKSLEKDFVIRNGAFNPIIKFPCNVLEDKGFDKKLPIEKIIISPYIQDENTRNGLLLYIRNKWGEVLDNFVIHSKSKVWR